MTKRQANKIGVRHVVDVLRYRRCTVLRATKILDREWRRRGEQLEPPPTTSTERT